MSDTDAHEWQGRTLISSLAERIGKITHVHGDRDGTPEWATVHAGVLGTKANFVPLAGAVLEGDDVRVLVTKAQVKDAPTAESSERPSAEAESALFEHYRVPHSSDDSPSSDGIPGTLTEAPLRGVFDSSEAPDNSREDQSDASDDRSMIAPESPEAG